MDKQDLLKKLCGKRDSLGLTYIQISQASGVPLSTVQKVLGGFSKNPRLTTLMALERAIFGMDFDLSGDLESGRRDSCTRNLRRSSSGYFVGESISPYSPLGAGRDVDQPNPYDADSFHDGEEPLGYVYRKHNYPLQGTYTVDDYYAVPYWQRVELIDGVIYDLDAPSASHQMILGELLVAFSAFIKRNKGNCVPFIAPCAVQLDSDNRTMVEPDFFVVCDRKKIRKKNIYGAPDLVMEVLSNSNRAKDMLIKAAKYQKAGVKEFWIIDPRTEQVNIYRYDQDLTLYTFSFDDDIPVGIFDSALVIHFKEIKESISFIKD